MPEAKGEQQQQVAWDRMAESAFGKSPEDILDH
jgi:hypothetical protein